MLSFDIDFDAGEGIAHKAAKVTVHGFTIDERAETDALHSARDGEFESYDLMMWDRCNVLFMFYFCPAKFTIRQSA